ncbi:hypothetical protein [Pseudomonas viridiflava]|uniref:hypothetical protein n=1 Tax=Pseudomonas viridiflava TaxID=33069 RepID=UPI0015E2F2B8|nr:hypothetical protein [Pseudomonas viridiflava]
MNMSSSADTTLHRAGDVERFPSGQTIYLAPLPLPTDALPHSPHVSDLNDVYLDFGGRRPQVFSWQVTLGGPFTAALFMLLGGPIIIALLGVSFGYGGSDVNDAMQGVFTAALVCCPRNSFSLFSATLQMPSQPWRAYRERSGHHA